LESDRSEPLARLGPGAERAFSEEAPAGSGNHSLCSAYDAVFLYLGLSLIDMGFKRKEVTLRLRELRRGLRRPIGAIITKSAAAYANGDGSYGNFDPKAPENRLFLLLPRVENIADYVAKVEDGDAWLAKGLDRVGNRRNRLQAHRRAPHSTTTEAGKAGLKWL
jgi:hypothetical protein